MYVSFSRSLALSLSRLSLSLCRSLALSLSRSLSLSLSLARSLTHSYSRSRSFSVSLSTSLALSRSPLASRPCSDMAPVGVHTWRCFFLSIVIGCGYECRSLALPLRFSPSISLSFFEVWGPSVCLYGDTSLIRNSAPLGPCSRAMARDLWRSYVGGYVL